MNEEYLDFYAGIAVNNAGSCNEKVGSSSKIRFGDIIHTKAIHTQFSGTAC